MNSKINIVLAADNNYAQHTAVTMASILLNSSRKKSINFYLLCDNISVINKDKISATVRKLCGNIEFLEIENRDFEKIYISGHVSRAAYFRLDIANILSEDIKKVIYLDADLLVYDDIDKLWSIDIKEFPIAAVADYGIMTSRRLKKQKNVCFGLPFDAPYFNSGVLILNLDLWRKNNYSAKVIECASNNKFSNHDQDALNKIFMNNWYELPLHWNVIPPIFNLFFKILLKSVFRRNAIKAKKNPSIFHYAGSYKPWEYVIYNGFNDKYYEYLHKTAFNDIKMPQIAKYKKGKSIRRQILRLKIANFWMKIFNN
ncbi:MAG: glycosyltransferase family 8 protein [Campylobacteraceae bacterium]|jgi:lipopolysaccharide biosynthesis glycosyltransferase|nr:glycosyltransferase family 8 protein [Campylobacteraceae bacterium]